MNKFRALTWVLILFIGISTASQSFADAPKIWMENPGGLSQDHITDGKKELSPGFFGAYDIDQLVRDNPQALEFAEKHLKYNGYAHLSYWLVTLPSAGVFGYGIGSRDDTMAAISLVTLVGSAILTGYFISESRHYLFESINTYNGVKKPAKATSGLQQAPLLSWSFNF